VVQAIPLVHSALERQNCAPVPTVAPGHESPAATVVHVALAVVNSRDPQQTCPEGQSQAEVQATATLSAGGQLLPPSSAFIGVVGVVSQSPVSPTGLVPALQV